MVLLAKASLAECPEALEEIRHAIESVVVAGEVRELGVEEVEDEVVGERVIVPIGEAGSDEFTGLPEQVEVRTFG